MISVCAIEDLPSKSCISAIPCAICASLAAPFSLNLSFLCFFTWLYSLYYIPSFAVLRHACTGAKPKNIHDVWTFGEALHFQCIPSVLIEVRLGEGMFKLLVLESNIPSVWILHFPNIPVEAMDHNLVLLRLHVQ